MTVKHKLSFKFLLPSLVLLAGMFAGSTPAVFAINTTTPTTVNGPGPAPITCEGLAKPAAGASDPCTCPSGDTLVADGIDTDTCQPTCPSSGSYSYACSKAQGTGGSYRCGGGDNAVSTSIDIGCKGKGNPITDLIFAVIRLLSDGVGLIVVGSIIVAGIQYTSSRGDPKATAAAEMRLRSTIMALLLYIFAYAILNYVIPVGFFKQ